MPDEQGTVWLSLGLPTRVHIDYAISIADWSTLRYHIPLDCPISRMNTHISTRAHYSPDRPNTRTMQTGDNYLGPSFERPLCTASPRQGTAAAPVKPPTSQRWQRQGRASWVARPESRTSGSANVKSSGYHLCRYATK